MVTKLGPGVFFGRVIHCRKVAGITLMESLYGPEVIIPPHEHAGAYDRTPHVGCSRSATCCMRRFGNV
jgi:hypothetical protein